MDALDHPWFRTAEFKSIYQQVNALNPLSVQDIENYKKDNIIKCAILAYLVHHSKNIPKCLEETTLFKVIYLN